MILCSCLYIQFAGGVSRNCHNESTPKLTDTPQTRHSGLVLALLSIVKNTTAIGDIFCTPHTEV